MATELGKSRDELSFGPFQLLVGERLLTRDGAPVDLGTRAFDLLLALTSSPGEIMGKQDLLARVWPEVIVEEGSLRFHMNGLRKALGDGKGGARYIATLPGRGYCFVAPVSSAGSLSDFGSELLTDFSHSNLPGRLSPMVGRDVDVYRLSAQLADSRVVSIIGPGGVGKTTVAMAVAQKVSDAFDGAVLFVDFGLLSDPNMVGPGVASMLGLAVSTSEVVPSLMAYLRDRRLLLILDTCEHLIDAVASLVAAIIESAPRVHILVTSREALRIDGERVYKLDALACPPDDPEMTVEDILSFPAAQLFLDRATACGVSLDLSAADAHVVASICRKLDGVALAVELAARRVESYGLNQTAALLEQHLALGWQGSRTAPLRQKTLQATLDWSFGLLTNTERIVLRRLAVFLGNFTLDAALEVVTNAELDQQTVFSAIDSLIAKSMVAAQPASGMMRYRLLDTTRAYALEIHIDDADQTELAENHASYYQRWLELFGADWLTLKTGTERVPHYVALNNVRAALQWCFSAKGNIKIGVALAAAAAPVLTAMSLLSECFRWSERALLTLDDRSRGSAEEMHLQAGLGISSMYLHGQTDATLAALDRALEIAAERGETITLIGIEALQLMFHFRRADMKASLLCARRARAAAESISDPAAIALSRSMLGRTLHVTGDLIAAREELEASLHHWSRAGRSSIYLAHDFHYTSDTSYARVLWLQGHPAQALAHAQQAIERVELLANPALFVVVLTWAASVFLWTGDLPSAEDYIDTIIRHAESNSISTFMEVGRARKAELAIWQGDLQNGVEKLQKSLMTSLAVGSGPLTTELRISLLQGLKTLRRFDEASALVDEEIQRVEKRGFHTYLPELLRVKGGICLSAPEPNIDKAENCLRQALELSREQGSRAWELRTANDLASLWANQGRSSDARALLQPVFSQFVEGLDTQDLKATERLLTTLR